jgi:hypothetical protein
VLGSCCAVFISGHMYDLRLHALKSVTSAAMCHLVSATDATSRRSVELSRQIFDLPCATKDILVGRIICRHFNVKNLTS